MYMLNETQKRDDFSQKYNEFFYVFSQYLDDFFKENRDFYFVVVFLKEQVRIRYRPFLGTNHLNLFFDLNNLFKEDLIFEFKENKFYSCKDKDTIDFESTNISDFLKKIRQEEKVSDELIIFIFILFFETINFKKDKKFEGWKTYTQKKEAEPEKVQINYQIPKDITETIIDRKKSLIKKIEEESLTKKEFSSFFEIYENPEGYISRKIMMTDKEIEIRESLLANDLFEENEKPKEEFKDMESSSKKNNLERNNLTKDKEPRNNKNRKFYIFLLITLLVSLFFIIKK